MEALLADGDTYPQWCEPGRCGYRFVVNDRDAVYGFPGAGPVSDFLVPIESPAEATLIAFSLYDGGGGDAESDFGPEPVGLLSIRPSPDSPGWQVLMRDNVRDWPLVNHLYWLEVSEEGDVEVLRRGVGAVNYLNF